MEVSAGAPTVQGGVERTVVSIQAGQGGEGFMSGFRLATS